MIVEGRELLEEFREVGEGGQLKEILTIRGLVDDLVLEDPGEVVRDKNCVETCRQGRIDVGAGAVADHPCVAGLAAVVRGEREVGVVVFFRENLDRTEVGGEAGAFELACLLFGIAFGDHDQPVPRSEFCESRSHIGQKLDLLVSDGLGETLDASALFIG